MNYLEKYWKHRNTILKSLEYYIDEISTVITREETSNTYVQQDLNNSIFSILEVMKEIQEQKANLDYYTLSEVVNRNKEIILNALDSNLRALEKSANYVSDTITKPPNMEKLNAQINQLNLAKNQLFDSEHSNETENNE